MIKVSMTLRDIVFQETTVSWPPLDDYCIYSVDTISLLPTLIGCADCTGTSITCNATDDSSVEAYMFPSAQGMDVNLQTTLADFPSGTMIDVTVKPGNLDNVEYSCIGIDGVSGGFSYFGTLTADDGETVSLDALLTNIYPTFGIPGCTEIDACNYNAYATDNDDSCEYPQENFDCEGNCISDLDCAGECGGDAVELPCGTGCGEEYGCTDLNACNVIINNGDSVCGDCTYPAEYADGSYDSNTITGTSTNWNCNGDCIAEGDNLGVVNGGTGPGLDCDGVCNGPLENDECGICDGESICCDEECTCPLNGTCDENAGINQGGIIEGIAYSTDFTSECIGVNECSPCTYTETSCVGDGCSDGVCNVDDCIGWNDPECAEPYPHCSNGECYCADGGDQPECDCGVSLDDCGVCGGDNSTCDECTDGNDEWNCGYMVENNNYSQCYTGTGCTGDGVSNVCLNLNTDNCDVCNGGNGTQLECGSSITPGNYCGGVINYCNNIDGDIDVQCGVVNNCGYCDNGDLPAGYTCVEGCNGIWCDNINCIQLVDDECGDCGGDNSDDLGCGCFEAAPTFGGTDCCEVDVDVNGCCPDEEDLDCGCGVPGPTFGGTNCCQDELTLGCCPDEPADDCGVCNGDGSDDVGCGCFNPAALEYFYDEDGDDLGCNEENGSAAAPMWFCLEAVPVELCQGSPCWVLDSTDEECLCATNDIDHCGVCGGGGSNDLGCGCGEHRPSGCNDCCVNNYNGDGCVALADDECGVCGGDGSDDLGCGCFEAAPSGCDNACGSDLVFDECGVCGGGGQNWNSEYLYEDGLHNCGCAETTTVNLNGCCNSDDIGCDNICASDLVDDCNSDCGGVSEEDVCGVCNGGGRVFGCISDGPFECGNDTGYCEDEIDDENCWNKNTCNTCNIDQVPELCQFSSTPEEYCNTGDDTFCSNLGNTCPVVDQCGICGGDGTSCMGCNDLDACNYESAVPVGDTYNIGCEYNDGVEYCQDLDGDSKGNPQEKDFFCNEAAALIDGYIIDCTDVDDDCLSNDHDCAGVCKPEGESEFDDCGECNLPDDMNEDKDECGECGGLITELGYDPVNDTDATICSALGGYDCDPYVICTGLAYWREVDCGTCSQPTPDCVNNVCACQAPDVLDCTDECGGITVDYTNDTCPAECSVGSCNTPCGEPQECSQYGDFDCGFATDCNGTGCAKYDCFGICGGPNSADTYDNQCCLEVSILSYYQDTDGDGIGDGNEERHYCAGTQDFGWVSNNDGCTDYDIDACGFCNGGGVDCCTDELACNYLTGSASCGEQQVKSNNCCFTNANYDCDGHCTAGVDCFGECGGTATLDECDVCGGDNSTCIGCTDMTACNYDENAEVDDGSCITTNAAYTGDYSEVPPDSYTGECFNTTTYGCDDCGVCGGDGTLCDTCLETTGFDYCNFPTCDQVDDCNGLCGGTALIDFCGVCGGNNICEADQETINPLTEFGVCNGTSHEGDQIDECGVCFGDGQFTCWDNTTICPNLGESCTESLSDENFDGFDDTSWEAGYTSAIDDFPADFIKGGDWTLAHQQFIAFTLPPKCGDRYGLPECLNEDLVCAGDPASDNTCVNEFDSCGSDTCIECGVCAQYETDRTLKNSVFGNIDDIEPTNLFTIGDRLFTRQGDDETGSVSYYAIFYTSQSNLQYSTNYSEDTWFSGAGNNYLEPGRGYWIATAEDLWLKWSNE